MPEITRAFVDPPEAIPSGVPAPRASNAARLLGLLEHLAATGVPRTQAQITRSLGIPRSTLSDMLAELRGLGYVAVSDRGYVPGPRLLAFVRRSSDPAALSAGVRPTLEDLARATGETAIWVIRIGDHVVAVDQVESAHPIRYVGTLDEPYPLRTTAAGAVFLAYGRSEESGQPEPAIVRERGYAIRSEEGTVTIAAPVTDADGLLVGAVSVIGPAERMRDCETRIAPLLREALPRLIV